MAGPSDLSFSRVPAFRAAEKQFQEKHEVIWKFRGSKRRASGYRTLSTDFTSVVDVHQAFPECKGSVHAALEPLNRSRAVPTNSTPQPRQSCHTEAFRVRQCPGCILYPAAIPPQLQIELATEAFTTYPCAPSRTNHTARHGLLSGLWLAVQRNLVLEHHGHPNRHNHVTTYALPDPSCPPHPSQRSQHACQASTFGLDPRVGRAKSHGDATDQAAGSSSELGSQDEMRSGWDWVEQEERHLDSKGDARAGVVTARSLLHKLRWATLGPAYDWTNRLYLSRPLSRPLPLALRDVAVELAPLPPSPAPPFNPNAAIVNYYHAGDTLNGHVDDVEADLRQPIVSLSLGVDAVFLLGGPGLEDAPLPLLLRSGDVLVMTSSARLCYHGVPRVLPGQPLPEAVEQAAFAASTDSAIMNSMRACRVNISVRHTHEAEDQQVNCSRV